MRRTYVARRYKALVGEPLTYDRDGQLRERELTQASADEMVGTLRSLIPDLAAAGPVRVVLSTFAPALKQGEYAAAARTIYLYATGHNECVLLHEIAHVTTPVVRGSRSKHIIHGAEYKATLLRYERIWRRHNHIRTKRVVTAAEETVERPVARLALPAAIPWHTFAPTTPPLHPIKPPRFVSVDPPTIWGRIVEWARALCRMR